MYECLAEGSQALGCCNRPQGEPRGKKGIFFSICVLCSHNCRTSLSGGRIRPWRRWRVGSGIRGRVGSRIRWRVGSGVARHGSRGRWRSAAWNASLCIHLRIVSRCGFLLLLPPLRLEHDVHAHPNQEGDDKDAKTDKPPVPPVERGVSVI